jgi:solute carrier family 8 (sodium/calcium exchanger)
VRVKVDTMDGSGTGGDDYVEIHSTIAFLPGEMEKDIEVEVIDDVEWEPDEEFYLKVSFIHGDDNADIKIGMKNTVKILIVNDDEPGTFAFDRKALYVKESCGSVVVTVFRADGADGRVQVGILSCPGMIGFNL